MGSGGGGEIAGEGEVSDVWIAEKWEGEECAPEAVNPWDLLGVDDSRVSFPDLPLDRAEFSEGSDVWIAEKWQGKNALLKPSIPGI